MHYKEAFEFVPVVVDDNNDNEEQVDYNVACT